MKKEKGRKETRNEEFMNEKKKLKSQKITTDQECCVGKAVL